MRKNLMGTAALVLLLLGSCTALPEPAVLQKSGNADGFHMTVSAGQTKTVIDPVSSTEYNVLWQSGDALAVYEVSGEGVSALKTVSDPLDAGGASASFNLSFSGSPSGPFTYTFVYPASALSKSGDDFLLTIPQRQRFREGSFDPAADVLVSRPVASATRPGTAHAYFARVGATAVLTLSAPSTSETLRRITLSTTESVSLTGSYTFDPSTGEVADMSGGARSVILTPSGITTYTGTLVLWFRTGEATLTDNLTVKVETDAKTYTKTVDLAAEVRPIPFRNGKLTKFAVDMSAVAGTESWDVITADYMGIKGGAYYDWSKSGSYSDAVYSGLSYKETGNFYMHKTGDNTGIVTTTSGGYVQAFSITLPSSGSSKAVEIYASNTAYTEPADLFDGEKQGTRVGVVSTSTSEAVTRTIWLEDAYRYIGFRVMGSYSISISEIRIKWEAFEPEPDHSGEEPGGWLEIPSYTVAGLEGTTTSSLSDLYLVTHHATMGGKSQRNYTLLYDPEVYAAYWVAYPLCADHLGVGRDEYWGYDPLVPSAKQTRLDLGAYDVHFTTPAHPSDQYYARGHQIPNADRNGVDAMMAQTYYATNITPQMQYGFNGGTWSSLEAAIRNVIKATSDTVYVVTGAAFKTIGGSESVSTIVSTRDSKTLPVPNYYWKAVLKVKWSGDTVSSAAACGFWLEHRDDYDSYMDGVTTVDDIETKTGLNLFSNLPSALQTSAENSADWAAFQSF